MTRTHVYSRGAATDLRAVARYTIEKWGEAQARSYIRNVEETAAVVATGRGIFKDLSALRPGLLMATSGKHFIFCLLRPGRPALILAILHERMDIMTRLKSRLT